MAHHNGNGDSGPFSFGRKVLRAVQTFKDDDTQVKTKKPAKRRALDLLDNQAADPVEDFRDVLFEAYQQRLGKKRTSSLKAQALWYDRGASYVSDEVKTLDVPVSMAELLDRVSRLARAHNWFIQVFEKDLNGDWALTMLVWYEIDPGTRAIKTVVESMDPALEHMLRTVMALHESRGVEAMRATKGDKKVKSVILPDEWDINAALNAASEEH